MDRSDSNSTERDLLRHAAWIRRLARGLVGDAATAEDLVQDAWVAALRSPPPEGRPLRPWLATVVRNAARQAFRGGGRRAAREADRPDPEPVAGPEELAEKLEVERRLTEELSGLEEPLRSTLMLRYYEGLEPTEIARRLGVPPGTVRWRVKRGLERLRERLDHRFGGRAQWCALLFSWTGVREGAATTVATSAAIVPGVLAMQGIGKLGIGAALVVVLAVGLGVGGGLPDGVWPFGEEAPLELASRPWAPEPEPAAVEDAVEAEPRRAVQPARAASPDEPEPVAAVAEAAAPTFAEARVVDAAGAPFAGADLVDAAGERSARSARDGAVRLELDPPDEPQVAQFVVRAPGFAGVRVDAVVAPGETVHLGTVELLPGGALSGRVVDEGGDAIPGARVSIGTVDEPRRALEERRLLGPRGGSPSAVTRADGSFTVPGVVEGFARVWAVADGYLASYSPPIEVTAGEEKYGLELVLDAMPARNRIRGLVLDPVGDPVPHARLDYRHRSERTGTTESGDRVADEDGEFEFLVPEDTRIWLTASDPGGRHGQASASDVGTGPERLVLQLAHASTLLFSVVGPGGEAIERFGFSVTSEDGTFEHYSEPRADRVRGRGELRVPAEPFVLEVDAPGHALARVGPLDPRPGHDEIEVLLEPVAGVTGRVVDAAGEPRSGARVRAHGTVAADRIYEKNGFRSSVRSDVVDEVTTDEEGLFRLTLREPGEYVLRADRTGLAPAVSAPFAVGASLAGGPIELVLSSGGAIEGRVLAPDGGDPAGTIVGLSRGDGYDRTVRVGSDGAYRFERLTPGSWRVLAVDEEIRPGRVHTSTRSRRGAARVEEWSCEVHAGETTRYDLVLAGADTCVLSGRFEVDGAAPVGWSARLVPEEEFFADARAEAVPLAPDGSFRLATALPGSYWLVLTGPAEAAGETYMLDPVSLGVGESDWEWSLKTGTLIVENAPAWEGEGAPSAVYMWDGPGRKRGVVVLAGDADGIAHLTGVPAGPARIARPELPNLDFDAWPTLVEVDVPEGGEARARLP